MWLLFEVEFFLLVMRVEMHGVEFDANVAVIQFGECLPKRVFLSHSAKWVFLEPTMLFLFHPAELALLVEYFSCLLYELGEDM